VISVVVGAADRWDVMHSEQHRQNPVSSWLMRSGAEEVGGSAGRSDLQDYALLRALARALGGVVPPAAGAGEPTMFDPDAAAIEIVTRGLDPELRAAVDADPHGTVLPRGGMTFAELDDLLASLVALAVHTATAAADRCESTAEEIVAAAALRLRAPLTGSP
jgi:hypothetical protein